MDFAVGQEPLASLFAATGGTVIASDFSGVSAHSGWAATEQMAESLDSVRWPGLIAERDFRARVTYENIDMRDLSALPSDALDFLWSSCAFEHLDSLENSLEFVRNSLKCLRPGGVAVHTTEYNLSSNDGTIDCGDSVIYRRCDIEAFDRSLRAISCAIEELDFDAGTEQHDIAFDYPPYYAQRRQHIKRSLHDHLSTSLLLIIRKAA